MSLVRSSWVLGSASLVAIAIASVSLPESGLARTKARSASAAVKSAPPAAPTANVAAPVNVAPTASAAASSAEARVFESAKECQALVAAGQRLARRAPTARLASWNLRWFPDGKPGTASANGGVDLEWLGCALTFLDADVIAVQEIKRTEPAKLALERLLVQLGRAAGATFEAAFDDCGSRVPQHVGFIWNGARAAVSKVRTLGELNPSAAACGGQLRPGLGASFRFRGGLDTRLVSVHFKSMADTRAFELRSDSFFRARESYRAYAASEKDDDFMLLGDFNTMGCDDCSPKVSGALELELAAQVVERAGLRFVPADASGSEFHRGKPVLLDHVVAARSMRELGEEARVHVSGACARLTPARGWGRSEQRRLTELSDHCPLVVDVRDQDLDP